MVLTRGRRTESQTRICLVSLLGKGTDSEERPQQKSCCRAGDETGVGLEEMERGEDHNLAIFGIPIWLWIHRQCLLDLGPRAK